MSAHDTAPLGELVAPKLGCVDPSKFPDEYFDLYSIPAFDVGKPEISRGSDIGSSKQIVEPNDVLLSRIVPHIRRAWIVGAARGRRLVASSEWIVFRSARFDPRYLRHVLVSDAFHVEFMRTVAGVGGSLLRARPAYAAQISIPLPPLHEQRRIADILDKADTLRVRRRAALAHLDTLTQSIFLEMFGDPSVNGKGFPNVRLGHYASKIGSGATPTGGEEAYKPSGIALIRSMNVRDGVFAKEGLAFIDHAQAARLDGVIVKPHDVLLNITGASVARVCRAPDAIQPARVNQHVAIIRAADGIAPAFLEHFLLMPAIKRQLLQIARAGATREAITKSQIENLRVLLPPIALQAKFDALVQRMDAMKNEMKIALLTSDALFESAQHRAFRGEL